MDLSNIEIISNQFTLRELHAKDKKDIYYIVKDYSQDATLQLYKAFLRNIKQIEKDMIDTDLEYLINFYYEMKNESLTTDREILKKIKIQPDNRLFSPYGPVNEEKEPYFKEETSISKYVDDANRTRRKIPRQTFRLGIEKNGKLYGCFVFDTKIENIKHNGIDFSTIGDIGIFYHTDFMRGTNLPHAIEIMMYFIENKIDFGIDKSNLYFSMTTHPCNQNIFKILNKRLGKDSCIIIHTPYGLRKQYLIPYNDFLTFLNPKRDKLIIKYG